MPSDWIPETLMIGRLRIALWASASGTVYEVAMHANGGVSKLRRYRKRLRDGDDIRSIERVWYDQRQDQGWRAVNDPDYQLTIIELTGAGLQWLRSHPE